MTLVHSRKSLIHRFGKELQATALEGLETLGIKVILGKRVVSESIENGFFSLTSGTTIPCDLLVCTSSYSIESAGSPIL